MSNEQAISEIHGVGDASQGMLLSLDLDPKTTGGGPGHTSNKPPNLYVVRHLQPPADASASVADLDAGDVIDAQTEFVKLTVGVTMWLEIGALAPEERSIVVEWLQGAEGEYSMNGQGRLVLGSQQTTKHLSADTKDAQHVLDAANRREVDADIWAFLNGGEQVLNRQDADSSDWKKGQYKPGSWYNSYMVKDGKVRTHVSAFDATGNEAPALDLAGLKALIMRCMDVGGIRQVVTDEASLEEALLTRYPEGHPLGDGAFGALCEELWSYLTTGAGPDQSVDIARLQAIVRALSPETKGTADTNTPFRGKPFTLPGTDVVIRSGDGQFGRATMMSLMHLFGELTTTVTEPQDIGLIQGGVFDDSDYFAGDNSGSMVGSRGRPGKWSQVVSAVDQSQGWGPGTGMESRTVARFSQTRIKVGQTKMTDMSQCLKEVYKTLHPADKRADRKAFAARFNLKVSDIFDGSGFQPRNLMFHIGDGGGAKFGATGESSLKTMLFVMTHPEELPAGNPLRERLERGTDDPNKDPVRLNGVADEPEQSLEYLGLVKDMAAELGIDTRIIFVPTDPAAYQVDPVGKLVIVDLENLEIDDQTNVANVTYSQGGKEHTAIIPIDGARGLTNSNRFRGASLDFNNGQEVRGVME